MRRTCLKSGIRHDLWGMLTSGEIPHGNPLSTAWNRWATSVVHNRLAIGVLFFCESQESESAHSAGLQVCVWYHGHLRGHSIIGYRVVMPEEQTQSTLTHQFFAKLIRFVLKYPKAILLLSVLLTVAAVLSIAYRFEIRSDIKDLMPPDAPVVQDLYKISERMGSITTLKIYLKTPELKALTPEGLESEAYQSCVAAVGEGLGLLRNKPIVGKNWCDNGLMLFSRQFSQAVASMDSVSTVSFVKDKSFFEKNILLYASAEELEKAYEQIDETLTEARRQSGEYKACLLTSDDESECESLKPSMASLQKSLEKQNGIDDSSDNLDSSESSSPSTAEVQREGVIDAFKSRLRERYEETELAQIDEFPYYAIQNGGWMVALDVRFKDSTAGLKAVQREIKRMDALRAELGDESYGTHIVVEYGGSFSDMKNEYSVIVADITKSISMTVLSIFLLIALFFLSFRASGRIFLPLVMSTLWSLGITFWAIGYLNLITSFIFAILLGLGIDFGIHLYSRYLLERRHGYGVDEALTRAVVETGTPLSLGVLTTAAAFFALMLGSFPGFSQFGFVAGLGVLIAFVTMTTVMPALVKVMEGLWPSKVRLAKPHRAWDPAALQHVRRFMIFLSIGMLIGAAYCATKIQELQFEDNFYNLSFKNEDSKGEEVVKTEKFAEAKRPTSPVIAVLDNTEQVNTLELYIKRNKEYVNFQWYRKAFARSLEPMIFVSRAFPEVMPYLGQARSLPIYAAFARTLPKGSANALPLSATYGGEKSRQLRKYRAFAIKMPQTARWISETFSEALHENTVANGLSEIVWMQGWLPPMFWEALPQWRSSQQLNSISDYASIYSYLPGTVTQQNERLAIIEKIRERTADRQIRFLPEDMRQKIVEFRPYLVDRYLSIDDLPEWVKLQFKEGGEKALPPREGSGVDYAFGNIAVMYQSTATYNGAHAELLAREARSIRIDGKPLTVATGAFVYSDMLKLVKSDGLQISVVAIVVILLLAALQKRRLFPVLLVTLPSIFGILMTLIIMGHFNLKLGLFNMVMLPVTLGISIDGAIYLYDRYQQMGRGSVMAAVRAVLPPVFMSSATTLVGFGGMITSRHMGLNTMGEMAIIGISICFFSTFMTQPGLILICEKLGLKSVVPNFDYNPKLEDEMASSVEELQEKDASLKASSRSMEGNAEAPQEEGKLADTKETAEEASKDVTQGNA